MGSPWAVVDQFLFGPDLLMAPIVEYQARERRVYLPEGVEWRDAWSDEPVHDGGVTIDSPAPIERIPVLVRGQNHALAELFQAYTSCRWTLTGRPGSGSRVLHRSTRGPFVAFDLGLLVCRSTQHADDVPGQMFGYQQRHRRSRHDRDPASGP